MTTSSRLLSKSKASSTSGACNEELRSLSGLALVESLIGLMNLVTNGLQSIDSHMGALGVTFTNEICHLLAYIGATPLPPMHHSLRGGMQTNWWADVGPVSALDKDLVQTAPPANLNPLRRKVLQMCIKSISGSSMMCRRIGARLNIVSLS